MRRSTMLTRRCFAKSQILLTASAVSASAVRHCGGAYSGRRLCDSARSHCVEEKKRACFTRELAPNESFYIVDLPLCALRPPAVSLHSIASASASTASTLRLNTLTLIYA